MSELVEHVKPSEYRPHQSDYRGKNAKAQMPTKFIGKNEDEDLDDGEIVVEVYFLLGHA